jgi:hypothetical protein
MRLHERVGNAGQLGDGPHFREILMRHRRLASIVLMMLMGLTALASAQDSTTVERPKARGIARYPLLNSLYEFVKEFSRVDTNYVEPQHYNYTLMLQNTNTYEVYHLRSKTGSEGGVLTQARIQARTIHRLEMDIPRLHHRPDASRQRRRTQRPEPEPLQQPDWRGPVLPEIGKRIPYQQRDARPQQAVGQDGGCAVDGFRSSIRGFNLYYIFNHRKFSYPAAYSQSTVQRRSAGSPIVGIGYTKHHLSIDWQQFEDILVDRTGQTYASGDIDTTIVFSDVNYTDYSVSGGYAYNWVFARNWLFDISLQAALAYKRTTNDMNTGNSGFLRTFDFKNINIDGILRTGVVWNNTKWYAGVNSIVHAYSYRKSQFSTNNIFGSVNFYVGFNFGKK